MKNGSISKAWSEGFYNPTILKMALIVMFILLIISVLLAVDSYMSYIDTLQALQELEESGIFDGLFDFDEHRSTLYYSTVARFIWVLMPVAWCIIIWWRYNKMRKDPLYVRDKKAEISDERSLMIMDKAKAKTFDFTLYLLATVAFAYFVLGDRVDWHYTPMIILGIVSTIMVFFAILYRKYQKTM
ncbi:MAG: hypothetical protein FWC29_00790 [Methanomassiliicoccaceae archaeon]|nr:hypothetical protein [Methanomassiliicoccaceae archaeon]